MNVRYVLVNRRFPWTPVIVGSFDTLAEAEQRQEAHCDIVTVPRKCRDCQSLEGSRCWFWELDRKPTDDGCNQGRLRTEVQP